MIFVRRQYFTAPIILLVTLLFGGCASNIKPYRAELPHNLGIISNTESVEASLHIYRLDKQCELTYLGSIDLDGNNLQLGIDTDQTSLLVAGFASSSFWSSSSGYIDYGITLTPRKAYRYEIEVSYIDNIYNVQAYEINRSSAKKREMGDRELEICRS
jgi:hypothetical protein